MSSFIPASAFCNALCPGSVHVMSGAIDISTHDLRIIFAQNEPRQPGGSLKHIIECKPTLDYPKGGIPLIFGVEVQSRRVLLFADPVTVEAKHGNLGPIKSVVLYDKDIDQIMGWWNPERSLTLINIQYDNGGFECDSFTVDFGDNDQCVVCFDYFDIPTSF
jgi:hypothetical protein